MVTYILTIYYNITNTYIYIYILLYSIIFTPGEAHCTFHMLHHDHYY